MGTQQISAPPCAQPAASGVIHRNVRHTAGFTVIGNHLAQHRGLSLVAVGLAVHIQSLPAGARIGIKRLAERFPESETLLQRTAAALLSDLRRHAPQLILSEADISTLVPGVVTWLERRAHPDTVRHALTADLPVPLKHPAKLLRHRIAALLPPPLPGVRDLAPPTRGALVIPLQNCDRCDRAFRSRHPGHCRDCRTALPTAA
ncbi:helix-turn-helix domain-containing protein [Streptomyces sp. NPDC057418]|uniref:helix-turn-helix domain-containing protein n=1 Tax=Streptomyces sp. NPDC057418 TaxID=3346126 RepID=UPI003690C46B